MVRQFLTYRDGQALLDLISLWDQRRFDHGRAASELVADLYRATRDVLDRPGKLEPDDAEQARNLALWAAMVLAWEERLLQDASGHQLIADAFVVTLEQLGRDFLARDVRDHTTDRLGNVWQDLYQSLARAAHHHHSDALAGARSRLLFALDRFLKATTDTPPRWLAMLSQRVRQAALEWERVQQAMELADDE